MQEKAVRSDCLRVWGESWIFDFPIIHRFAVIYPWNLLFSVVRYWCWNDHIFTEFAWLYLQAVRELVRQLAHVIFITNNHISLHLIWKENLVKHQKVSKYYDYDWIPTVRVQSILTTFVISVSTVPHSSQHFLTMTTLGSKLAFLEKKMLGNMIVITSYFKDWLQSLQKSFEKRLCMLQTTSTIVKQ